jgi:site-specific DNA-methyltransferase (cytosine-N4-specific)
VIPYYQDESVTLHHGDALTVLSSLPDASVNCAVTSPPYFGLRDYGVDGQLGLETSPAEYVENLRALFAQVRRVLADDGTLWLNLGDSYIGSGQPGGVSKTLVGTSQQITSAGNIPPKRGLPPKNLLGIPWRVAFALQDDGWILRNDIIWAKPNAMPESVTDRLSTKHEHLLLFSKRARYWFDLDPIREPFTPQPGLASSFARDTKEADVPGQSMRQHRVDRTGPGKRPELLGRQPQGIEFGGKHDAVHLAGKNPGDVWSIPTQPFSAAHFAVMPRTLAERAIQSGCKPGGTVLDPFSGSGTTGLAAARHGRKYVGVDLNAEYLDMSLRTRLAQPGLDFDTKEAI